METNMHPLMPSIVRILTPENRVAGPGFLVSEKKVVTATYVVCDALGVQDSSPMPTQEIYLNFVLDKQKKLFTAHTVCWWPEHDESIAILELENDLPDGVQSAYLVTSNNLSGHAFRSFGFPSHYDNGLWVSGELQETQPNRWIQIESSREKALTRGLGGSPVWDTQLMGVVGMVIEADYHGKFGFMYPISRMVEIWPELSNHVVQRDSEQDTTKADTHFIGPISGQIHAETGDITIRIAREALVANETSGPARVGLDTAGDVVIVESETSKIIAKLPQEMAYDNIAATAATTRKQIAEIHDQGRKQAEQWSRFSLIAAILGFLIVIGGGLAMLLGNVPAGLVTSAAGIIPEVAAALFFQQAREANKRVDDIRERLLDAEGIHRAIELAMTTDEETQKALKKAIILRILGLPVEGKEVQISTDQK